MAKIKVNKEVVEMADIQYGVEEFKRMHKIHPVDTLWVVENGGLVKIEEPFYVLDGMEFHSTQPIGIGS